MGRRSTHAGAAVAAGVLLAGVVSAAPAYAITNVGCSTAQLIAAINASNGMVGGDTLALTSYCVYTLADSDGTLPTITQPLTIQGNHATIRRDPAAATQFGIFEVGGVALTMDTLTVMNGSASATGAGGVDLGTTDGSLSATNVNFQGNAADDPGKAGAINAASGTTLSLTGGTVNDNRNGSGPAGIYAQGTTGVTLSKVTLSRNRSGAYGGGIIIDTSQPAAILNSTIDYNTAKSAGGGLYFTGSNMLTVIGTTIADNRVTNSVEGGGGVLADSTGNGSVTFQNVRISGNTVTGFDTPTGLNHFGGGIFLEHGQFTLDSSKVTGNRIIGADGRGAGIAMQPESSGSNILSVQSGTTVTGNLASGRYSKGGGIYVDKNNLNASLSVSGSHVDANKVTGTGAVSGGIYNIGGSVGLFSSSVNNNIAPIAPAPGGVWTDTQFSNVFLSTISGNTPTNCLLSPVIPFGCVG
ncbi:right-handed parallel beta-helix repeat-containing protein [Streptomyces sp. NPDC047022]|uniref:right-handed parallel beta-helix repeat-containing protein n=1 Tax=Streptomyces sp. NPDC047022 TaxID=3155737 RepID=UPI0033F39310